MAFTTQIVSKLKEIQRKDQVSLAVKVNDLPAEDQRQFLQVLSAIEKSTVDKAKSDSKTTPKSDKAEEEGQFIGRLRAKLEAIENERVRVETRFINCRKLLLDDVPEDATEASLARCFTDLSSFISGLDVLKCLARRRQGEVVLRLLEQGRTTAAAAKILGIPLNFAERLVNFAKFAKRFPLLVLTGYSFETLLKYKKRIETEALADENFASKMELEVNISFEDEHDDKEID